LDRIAKLADAFWKRKRNRLVSFSKEKKNARKFGVRADWKDKDWLPRFQLGFHLALANCVRLPAANEGGLDAERTGWRDYF
jgi:hypothetical protein